VFCWVRWLQNEGEVAGVINFTFYASCISCCNSENGLNRCNTEVIAKLKQAITFWTTLLGTVLLATDIL